MDKIAVYEKALEFSRNTLLGLSHKYKRQTFLTDDDIIQNVAADCFERSLKKEMSKQEIVIFCKALD